MTEDPNARTTAPRIALVLGGGNALGAYHAGLYQALREADIEPDRIVGTSIGAITGAIIAGNPREARLDRLRRFWRPADTHGAWPMPWDLLPERWRRTEAVLRTALGGRTGVFGPLGVPLALSPWERPAVYDSSSLRATLAELVDFELLNRRAQPFSVIAVDVESGRETEFLSHRDQLEPDHIRASAALLPAFPPVEIGGRAFADGGLAMNLPLDPVVVEAGDRPTLCIAADLLPLRGAAPRSLGEAAGRAQDLMFAAQSQRTIARWQAVFDARQAGGDTPPAVTIVRLAYHQQAQEVAGKAMDFSPASTAQRWSAGYDDGVAMLARLRDGAIEIGRPGLTVDDGDRSAPDERR